jgi:hypothetical protein
MLTQKRLCEVLNYTPETGLFTWAKGARKGKVAGTMHDGRGDLKVSIDNERHLLHRLAWLWMTGGVSRWSVEHINGDHGDNRWANLREGDRGQKRQYQALWREPTSSPGVWQVGDQFEAMIHAEGRAFNLGSFSSITDARAVVAVALQRARDRPAQRRRRAA